MPRSQADPDPTQASPSQHSRIWIWPSKGFTRPQVLYHGLHKMNLTNVMRLGISDLHTEESEGILDDCKLHAKSNSLSDSCLVTSLAG